MGWEYENMIEEMTGQSFKVASEQEYSVKEVKGEPTVIHSNGGMSSHLDVDYSLMPNTEFIEDVIEVLTLGCTEHGGKYPRDNWRKLPVMDNMTHALQHTLKLHGKMLELMSGEKVETEEFMVELTHAVCRLWFLHEQLIHRNPDFKPKPALGQIKEYTVLGDK